MNELPKTPDEFFKMMQDHMPKIQPTQNGYEIRAKILELAQTQAMQPIMLKFGAYKFESQWEADEFVSKVEFPNADEVLKIAGKFNDFVSGKASK